MSRVAIIPARGGSKRIARKNLKGFCGKPIILYALETAKKTELFDQIYVSTEDSEIASVASESGAEIISRPPALADDFTTTSAVLRHAINTLLLQNISINEVCCIYPTTPLLTPESILKGYRQLKANPDLFAFPVVMAPAPIAKILKLDVGSITRLFDSSSANSRSQDLEVGYTDAGQYYWGTKENWLHCENIIENGVAIIEGKWKFIDINDNEDWNFAEELYQYRRKLDATEIKL